MTSGLWDNDPVDHDSGGVHTNSGVGNKAAWLIAHGGTFNGVDRQPARHARTPPTRTASTLKVAQLYWATQRPAAEQRELPHARLDARTRRASSSSPSARPAFVARDCTQSVATAVAATEMTTTKVAGHGVEDVAASTARRSR